jgi:hypothetical protein
LAVSVLALSCGMSSGLLSDSERSSLYSLSVSVKDGQAISDGAIVYPGTQVTALVAKSAGASDPSVLDVSLLKQDGTPAAALRFASSKADMSKFKSLSTLSSKSVAGIDGKLEGFTVPAGQEAGAYQLTVAVLGPDGSSLQQETISIFVGPAQPSIDSASVFPPSVEPGASVLLGLTVSWLSLAPPDSSDALAKQVNDPWIKWSRDGSVFAEGLQSAGFSKVVWTAPRIEGAYSVRAEVFPSAPAKGTTFSFKAAASQDLRVMVIAAQGGSGNDFADPLAFYSLLKFDGSFDDLGTRLRSAQPESFGSPLLDTYSSGFGYRFGSLSGVRIPGLMPPSASGKLDAFAVLLRLAPDQSDGSLVRFASADASYSLVLGLKGGTPYVESQVSGAAHRSVALSAIPRGPLTLEAIFSPVGDELSISWRAEGVRIEAPSLPLPSAPPSGSATLGGSLSLSGVYDGFGVLIPGASSAYPSPTYRLASRRKWKSSLVMAEGFEDGVLPASSTASGSVSLSSSGLTLDKGASLALSPNLDIGAGLVVEAGIEDSSAGGRLDFSTPDGERAFEVSGAGTVSDASGKVLGTIPVSDASVGFSLELRDGGPYLIGSGEKSGLGIPGSAKRLILSLRQEGTVQAVFTRILVRSASSASNP